MMLEKQAILFPWRPNKGCYLRYGDMEYVMLHLIFIYLMPGEGQPAAYAASDL